MSTLANLTNEECLLLVEVLSAKQKELQLHPTEIESREECEGDPRRQEVLEQLLWHAKLGCLTRMPDDGELRRIGSYA